jgi:hypothetical protein
VAPVIGSPSRLTRQKCAYTSSDSPPAREILPRNHVGPVGTTGPELPTPRRMGMLEQRECTQGKERRCGGASGSTGIAAGSLQYYVRDLLESRLGPLEKCVNLCQVEGASRGSYCNFLATGHNCKRTELEALQDRWGALRKAKTAFVAGAHDAAMRAACFADADGWRRQERGA